MYGAQNINALLSRFGGYSPPTGWGGPQRVTSAQPQGSYVPPQVDPRRAARDPRYRPGGSMAQPQGQGWVSPFRNALMANMGDFQGVFGVPQQGYRTGQTYTQGQGPRYSPPPSPQEQAFQGFANAFRSRAYPTTQPTAPRTMGKPTGRPGRMY